jgi:Domain of unknown function (DUF1707)
LADESGHLALPPCAGKADAGTTTVREQATMTSNRATRAADADRERIAAALGGHYAAGRLTLEEFQERLDRAYAAKTLGELDDLMADLPRTDLSRLSGQCGTNPPLPERRAPGVVQARVDSDHAIWQLWLWVAIATFAIWLITGASGGPWFLWAAVPLAFIILRRWSIGRERRIRDHQGRQ